MKRVLALTACTGLCIASSVFGAHPVQRRAAPGQQARSNQISRTPAIPCRQPAPALPDQATSGDAAASTLGAGTGAASALLPLVSETRISAMRLSLALLPRRWKRRALKATPRLVTSILTMVGLWKGKTRSTPTP